MKNTLRNCSVRFVVFREKRTWYAVGLEFNIVESGKTEAEAITKLFNALSGYVESLRKIKGYRAETLNKLLNQKADDEYERIWVALHKKSRSIKSPYTDIKIGNYQPVYA